MYREHEPPRRKKLKTQSSTSLCFLFILYFLGIFMFRYVRIVPWISWIIMIPLLTDFKCKHLHLTLAKSSTFIIPFLSSNVAGFYCYLSYVRLKIRINYEFFQNIIVMFNEMKICPERKTFKRFIVLLTSRKVLIHVKYNSKYLSRNIFQ